MRNRHFYLLASGLAAVGFGLFLYKALVLGLPLTPEKVSDTWEVETRIAFTAKSGPVKVSIVTPQNARGLLVVDQGFVSRGYGLSTAIDSDNRRAVFGIRKATGEQTLYYRFTVYRFKTQELSARAAEPRVPNVALQGTKLAAAQSLLRAAEEASADAETLVAHVLQLLNRTPPDPEADLLLGKNPPPSRRVKAAVQILALGRLPVRAVHGIRLAEARRHAQFVHWLEVYSGERWLPFEPETGAAAIPDSYFPWWRGPARLVLLEGGDRLEVDISVATAAASALQTALTVGRVAERKTLLFSLLGLPLHTQQVYKVLLTIPVGVLLLVLLRNVIGIRTFGTFMPVLIALAFRETELAWGVVLFTIVVGLGLAVRLYLENLKLLLVPRLACVLIVVVLTMLGLSVISHLLGFERGLSVALFPMVILTMAVERMSVVWDEVSAAEALKQGVGSLVVAALCYLLMSLDHVEHWFFVFPELLLVLLAGTVLLGRYSGYRLLELSRFRVLAEKSG